MKITKEKYLKAKAIVEEYERLLKQSFVRGSFKASDIEIFSYAIWVPSIKAHMVTDSDLQKLQDKLSDVGFPWSEVGVDDNGFLSVGSRELTLSKYEAVFLEALNDL